MAQQDLFRESDGFDKYRWAMNDYVSKIIQNKLHQNQNPKDCSKARKMVS